LDWNLANVNLDLRYSFKRGHLFDGGD